ncbi:hypothetical protein GCM10027592_11280 [Spirosoma flavus]
MNFQLSSTSGTGSFDLLDAQQSLVTHFQYESWFSSTGSASLDNKTVTIKPRNFWHSAFDVLLDDVDKGDIMFNWKGNILIRLQNTSDKWVNYRLKTRGFWEFRFVLEDEQQTPLLQLIPSFKWSQMGYNYQIDFTDTFSPAVNSDLITLLLACGYGTNLYMSTMAAAT